MKGVRTPGVQRAPRRIYVAMGYGEIMAEVQARWRVSAHEARTRMHPGRGSLGVLLGHLGMGFWARAGLPPEATLLARAGRRCYRSQRSRAVSTTKTAVQHSFREQGSSAEQFPCLRATSPACTLPKFYPMPPLKQAAGPLLSSRDA